MCTKKIIIISISFIGHLPSTYRWKYAPQLVRNDRRGKMKAQRRKGSPFYYLEVIVPINSTIPPIIQMTGIPTVTAKKQYVARRFEDFIDCEDSARTIC